jgi:hypothetical protein
MNGSTKGIISLGAALTLATVACTQNNTGFVGTLPVNTGFEGAPPDWFVECTDPTNTKPLSNPYTVNYVANELMWCAIGGSGNWNAGSASGLCFAGTNGQGALKSIPNAGKFTFSYGNYQGNALGSQAAAPQAVGSVQQYTPNFHNAGMAINFGAPYTPSYCAANLILDNTQSYFGNALQEFYFGQSNRYVTAIQTVGSFTIDLQIELVADAVRFRWTCVNNTSAPHSIALWFGSGIEMLLDQNAKYWPTGGYAQGNFGQPYISQSGVAYGPDQSGEPPFFDDFTNDARLPREAIPNLVTETVNGFLGPFIYVPNQRPPNQDTQYILNGNPAQFPDYVDFDFDESDPFGIRMETKPSTSTNDTNPTDQPLYANELTVGKAYFLMGDTPAQPVFTPNNLLPDTGFLSQPAFVLQYDPHTVQGGQTYQMLNYVRTTWGNGDYKLPFGAVVDAPSLVQAGTTNFDGTPAPSGLVSNTPPNDPLRIRVWVDNVGGNVTSGYGVNNKEFTLNNVQIKLSFGSSAIKVLNTASQIIPSVLPRTTGKVDFQCQVGNEVIGNVPYTVTIDTVPINHKTITGVINVAGRPQTRLYPGPNMITAPFVFQDNSWLTILQDFLPGGANVAAGVSPNANFTTYVWDPVRQAYNISLDSQRSGSVWVVYNNPTSVFSKFEGSPSLPQAYSASTYQIELKPGWNMIANPFNIVYQLNEVNGVAQGDANQVFTYDQLVGLGYISGFVASYDPTLNSGHGGYNYVDGTTGLLQPNVGYWIDVLLPGEITLSLPPLFTEGSPGSYNTAPTLAAGLWRLGLTAQQGQSIEPNVTVGNATNASAVRTGTMYKAPMAPTQSMSFAILGKQGTKSVLLNQALTTTATQYSWTAQLSSQKSGPVAITWPNIASVPKSLGVFVQDLTSGVTVDARQQSNYGYYMLLAGSRQFKILATAPVQSTTLIGQVVGTSLKIGATVEEKISYTLQASGTTTVKVLSATGAVVNVLHTQRVDKLGLNEDLWNLKTTAGAKLPAGRYTVQISAVTPTGQEQTKSAIITVL